MKQSVIFYVAGACYTVVWLTYYLTFPRKVLLNLLPSLIDPVRRRAPALLLSLLTLAAAQSVYAGCTRDINVPMAAIGASVVIKGNEVSGIYPEMLRSLGSRIGCNFVFSPVPRARLVAMFDAGTADLLLPATRNPKRAPGAIFVPLLGSRSVLISLNENATIQNAQQLLEHQEIRLALVRGYDFGEEYQAIVAQLAKQGRVFYEADPLAVARLLQAGYANATIMAPTTLSGAVQDDPRVRGLFDKLRIQPLPELPWGVSGVYISTKSMPPEDQALLRDTLEKAARGSGVLEAFQRHHRPEVLQDSVRALPAGAR